ncbi:hypothetical protein VP01_2470g3 [Puccinia sorghi]|uniref:Uncharacterized protein n=1 Tax=Puccinia sorghi TaxID=27349 RepID=A0A0L6V5X0_9BASI|nr:hypothetical protein VP01_2470g3 [Puccinia sorghi]
MSSAAATAETHSYHLAYISSTPQQRLKFADTCKVAFLPDADKSLLGKQLAIEKLSDKDFVNKFFYFAGEKTDLAHISGSDEEDEEMNKEDADFLHDDQMDSAREENNKHDTENDDAKNVTITYQAMLIDEDLGSPTAHTSHHFLSLHRRSSHMNC